MNPFEVISLFIIILIFILLLGLGSAYFLTNEVSLNVTIKNVDYQSRDAKVNVIHNKVIVQEFTISPNQVYSTKIKLGSTIQVSYNQDKLPPFYISSNRYNTLYIFSDSVQPSNSVFLLTIINNSSDINAMWIFDNLSKTSRFYSMIGIGGSIQILTYTNQLLRFGSSVPYTYQNANQVFVVQPNYVNVIYLTSDGIQPGTITSTPSTPTPTPTPTTLPSTQLVPSLVPNWGVVEEYQYYNMNNQCVKATDDKAVGYVFNFMTEIPSWLWVFYQNCNNNKIGLLPSIYASSPTSVDWSTFLTQGYYNTFFTDFRLGFGIGGSNDSNQIIQLDRDLEPQPNEILNFFITFNQEQNILIIECSSINKPKGIKIKMNVITK